MPRVLVSIGSNQDRERSVRRAVRELDVAFEKVCISATYETDAVGFVGDPFFNLVAAFDTDLPVDALLARLRAIETRCGRVRTHRRYGPRTMDIDILTYGDLVSDDESLEIPRSEILREAYVLKPLVDIAPDVLHPQLGESYAALRGRLRLRETHLRLTDFDPRDASMEKA